MIRVSGLILLAMLIIGSFFLFAIIGASSHNIPTLARLTPLVFGLTFIGTFVLLLRNKKK